MVRSTPTVLAKLRREIRSSAGMSTSSATEAIPGLPGAAKISSARGLCERASTSACSRPPLPTTSRRTSSGLYPLDYRLVPLGTDANHTQRRPYLFFDEGDEGARLLGQLLPPPAPRNVHAPAGERLVDRAGVVQIGLVHGEVVNPLTVELVPHAYVHLLYRREYVKHRECEPVDPVYRGRELNRHEIQPPTPPWTPRGGPVLVPDP